MARATLRGNLHEEACLTIGKTSCRFMLTSVTTTRLGTIGVVKNDQQFDTILPMKVDRVTIDDEEDLLADVHQ